MINVRNPYNSYANVNLNNGVLTRRNFAGKTGGHELRTNLDGGFKDLLTSSTFSNGSQVTDIKRAMQMPQAKDIEAGNANPADQTEVAGADLKPTSGPTTPNNWSTVLLMEQEVPTEAPLNLMSPMEKMLQGLQSQAPTTSPFEPGGAHLKKLGEGSPLSAAVADVLTKSFENPGVKEAFQLHTGDEVSRFDESIRVSYDGREVDVRPNEDGSVSVMLGRDPNEQRLRDGSASVFQQAYSGTGATQDLNFDSFAIISDSQGGFRQANLKKCTQCSSRLETSYDSPNAVAIEQVKTIENILKNGTIKVGAIDISADAKAKSAAPAPF